MIDFRAFTKLTRLGLRTRFWEDEQVKGFPLEFSVDENGQYDFLPVTLQFLFLIKPGSALSRNHCKKILEAGYRATAKATSLEDVIVVTTRDVLPAGTVDIVATLATVDITVSARYVDFRLKGDQHDEYLKVFEEKYSLWPQEGVADISAYRD